MFGINFDIFIYIYININISIRVLIMRITKTRWSHTILECVLEDTSEENDFSWFPFHLLILLLAWLFNEFGHKRWAMFERCAMFVHMFKRCFDFLLGAGLHSFGVRSQTCSGWRISHAGSLFQMFVHSSIFGYILFSLWFSIGCIWHPFGYISVP